MEKTISKSEATILRESHFTASEYPQLVAGLVQGIRDIQALPEHYETAHLARIIGTCKLEWSHDEKASEMVVTSESPFKACQLCGTGSVKTLYYIQNSKNGKELWIGSECVKTYKFSKYLGVNELQKRQRATVRYKTLSDIFPHFDETFFHQGQAHARRSTYLIPKEMEDRNVSIFTSVRRLADEFLASEHENQSRIIGKMKELIEQYNLSSIEIDEFQTLNSTNWLYPKKSYLQYAGQVLKALRKTLSIDGNTIGYIINQEFSQDHVLPRLNHIVRDTGIMFTSVNLLPNDVEYIGEINSYHFTMGHKELCKEWGKSIVNETPIASTHHIHFLKMATVREDDSGFFREVFSYLQRWKMRAMSYAPAYNQLYVIEKGDYVRLPLNSVVRIVTPYVMLKKHFEAPAAVLNILKVSENRMDSESYWDNLHLSSLLSEHRGKDNSHIDPEFIILDS